jgi:hypothetical protein
MFQAGLKRARTALEAVAPAVAPSAGVAALRPALPPHLARRAFSVSTPARGIEEFLPPALKEGELPKGAGACDDDGRRDFLRRCRSGQAGRRRRRQQR